MKKIAMILILTFIGAIMVLMVGDTVVDCREMKLLKTYTYYVSVHDYKVGFGMGTCVLPDKIRGYSDLMYIRGRIMYRYKMVNPIILNWERLK